MSHLLHFLYYFPLSIAGRVVLKDGNKYKKKIVNLTKPLCVIPSEAIHQNKSANTNLDLNAQIDLIPVISLDKEKDTTTDSISSSIFKEICKKVKVPFQDSVSRNDLTTGLTLSGLCMRHVSIDSIDVGISQLVMHSARELIGSYDLFYLYKAFKKFYNIYIKHCQNTIEIIDK